MREKGGDAKRGEKGGWAASSTKRGGQGAATQSPSPPTLQRDARHLYTAPPINPAAVRVGRGLQEGSSCTRCSRQAASSTGSRRATSSASRSSPAALAKR